MPDYSRDHSTDTELAAMSRAELESYVRNLEYLCGDRDRLLEALPDCSDHGPGCVPYALAWIAEAHEAVRWFRSPFRAMGQLGQADPADPLAPERPAER